MSASGRVLAAAAGGGGTGSNATLVSLHDQAVELRYPHCVAADIEFIYRDSIAARAPSSSSIVVEQAADGRFTINAEGDQLVADLTRGDLPTFVMDVVVRGLIKDLTSAVALHAGAVAYKGRAALIVGATGAGKSSLVAWLIANNFDYLTDEIALYFAETATILGLPRALVLKPGAASKVEALASYRGARSVPGGDHVMLRPDFVRPMESKPHPCDLIVFPEFAAGSELHVEPLSAAQTALRLVGNNLNARNLPDGGFGALANLGRQAPGLILRYGDFDQLQGTADVLMRLLLEDRLDAAEGRRFLSLFARQAESAAPVAAPAEAEPAQIPEKKYPIPAATPRREPRKLTIGMATYDDYDGVYFSVQALRLYHPEILEEAEILVVRNHPDGPCAQSLRRSRRARRTTATSPSTPTPAQP